MQSAFGLKSLVRTGLFVCLALLLTQQLGCRWNHHSKGGFPVGVNLYADVETQLAIGKPVSATVEVKEVLWLFVIGMPKDFADGMIYGPVTPTSGFSGLFGPGIEEAVKSAAAYQALKQGDYDVLLGAKYHVQLVDNFFVKTIKATVKGRGAKVTGYQQVH